VKQGTWNGGAVRSMRVTISGCVAILLGVSVAAQAAPGTPTGASPGTTGSPGPTLSGSTVTLSWNAVSDATSTRTEDGS